MVFYAELEILSKILKILKSKILRTSIKIFKQIVVIESGMLLKASNRFFQYFVSIK